jgi:NTE family protein
MHMSNVKNNKLAFVLSGGGARGALQVGSLYSLLENGFLPDLLVGTSIGAVNAAFLAVHGFSRGGLDLLTGAWHRAASLDLLPNNYVRLSLRAMLGRSSDNPAGQIRDFLIKSGLTPELRFADIKHLQLIIVSSDLNTGKPVLHGMTQEEKVLDALLISTALPPWSMPVRKQQQFLMDGGVVSNLPIEAALQTGATRIVALDLSDMRETFGGKRGLGLFLNNLAYAMERREGDLELRLAKAQGVPVFYISLMGKDPTPILDFHHVNELIAQGYEMTCQAIAQEAPGQFSP